MDIFYFREKNPGIFSDSPCLFSPFSVSLHCHLERHEIDYLQFSFRWFNNLLMRELPLGCTVRLWDTLHAEPDGFSHFVLYVCAAFLKHFSQHLMAQRDFQVRCSSLRMFGCCRLCWSPIILLPLLFLSL